MNTEHTTETWTAFQNPEDIGSNYWRIRVAGGLKDSLHGYCGERRARLAAAAPELLAALKKCARIIGSPADSPEALWRTDAEVNDAYNSAHDAIAKAKGGAQ